MTAGGASVASVYRGAAAILWALAIWNSVACRGLFWDGSAFLVEIIDNNWFHWMFYPARAHVMWLTQLPVVVALKLGVTDTRFLAVAYSAGSIIWRSGARAAMPWCWPSSWGRYRSFTCRRRFSSPVNTTPLLPFPLSS